MNQFGKITKTLQERFLVQDIINKYSNDYKVIIVGDATMAPYEITNPGGSIEHWNEEAEYLDKKII